MRSSQVILTTLGDNPLLELMELDEMYQWSARIHAVRSFIDPPRRSSTKGWVIALLIILLLGLGLVATASYFLFFH